MTIRTALLCLLLTVGIGAFTYFNDYVIRQGMLVGDLMPVIGYGGLALFTLVLNPIIAWIRRSWTFNRRELALICSITLIAGATAGWGLWGFLPTSIMMPQQRVKIEAGWKRHKVMEDLPPQMIPKITPENESRVLNSYVCSARTSEEHISIETVPWKVWLGPLRFWVPMGLTLSLALVGLALLMHRQWAYHEQQPYPIASFAQALLPQENDWKNSVYTNRLFWVGCGTVFLILIYNWICRVYPQYLRSVPLQLDFSSLAELIPTVVKGGGNVLLSPRIFLTTVGLSFFLASDVSFSMGVMPWFFCLLYGLLESHGIPIHEGNHLTPKITSSMYFAGYLTIVLAAIYHGRFYYWSVLRKSLGLKTRDEIGQDATWGMRLFLLCSCIFVYQLIQAGLSWYLAIAYTLIGLCVFIGVNRAVVESGAIQIGTVIFPGAILLTFLGPVTIGPRMLIIMYIVSTVLLAAPSWSPFVFLAHALKIGDSSGLAVGSVAKYAALTILLCSVIAIPATIYWQYDYGADQASWTTAVAVMPYDNIVMVKDRLQGQDLLDKAQHATTWERLSNIRPKWRCVYAFIITFAAALLCTFCRLRLPWWPIHPVIFIFLGGGQARVFAWSFFIGWLIKSLTLRYGGSRAYNTMKPLMIGIIAGDLLGRLIPMLVMTTYYLITGDRLIG
ncbi:MAG: hypothetical protein D6820_10050 [Lentisphaerae bacterium]|nr:MAG: hypothetical protein D6820_10050 [Lentisphaerota bacterium]